jgi:hypothetical protein
MDKKTALMEFGSNRQRAMRQSAPSYERLLSLADLVYFLRRVVRLYMFEYISANSIHGHVQVVVGLQIHP